MGREELSTVSVLNFLELSPWQEPPGFLASNCLGPLVPGSGCNQVEMGWDKKLGEIALSEHSIPGDTRQGPLLHCSSETGNEQRLDSLRSQS